MTPRIVEITGDEPITIEEARQHLEAQPYGDSDVDPADDAMIEAMLGAAREHCEAFLGLSLTTRTLEVALDSFPVRRRDRFPTVAADLEVLLPMGPVREVLTVSWGDGSDDEMANDQFVLKHSGAVAPIAGWPSVAAAPDVIKIRYIAGYGVDSDGGQALPKAIRAAILLVLGDLYANRENSGDKAMASLPIGAEALMRPLRVRLGMA